ncbi:hypothetical protein [Chryseobacterium sp. JK1]|uniref:hypothetical protein n=1 Tax=Chryseobacterium sp. JK1 TaxID=874294 RepID=UPI003D6878A6
MQKFWYHSPVRFYRTSEELEDMTNPQNTQFYGHKEPYPLQVKEYHRFLIPNYKNEVGSDLKLFLIAEDETEIHCQFGISEGKLFRLTFICFEEIQGHFEIRNEIGDILYYSNCVKFTDSTDADGRQFIRVATKCAYNRNLFSYANNRHDWMITNLPAYCMGEFTIDEELTTAKSGNDSTIIKDGWSEEVVSYRVLAEGDNNILSFIAVHTMNKDFYIDGTKRTRKEKLETTDHTSEIEVKFTNQKDENGLNILLDEKEIFADVIKFALGNDDKTKIYTYDNNKAIQTR